MARAVTPQGKTLNRKRLRRISFGLAVAACIGSWTVGAASPAGQESRSRIVEKPLQRHAVGTVGSAGNDYYMVHVDESDAVGTYTITTGPLHSAGPGVNVLYGDGFPGSSTNTIRSYTTGTDYRQGEADLDSNGSVALLGTTGFRTTYMLPGPPATPDTLTIVQVVDVHGTTAANSSVEVTTTVTNDGVDGVLIGLRYLWDYKIGSDDGPTFQALNPDGAVLLTEAAFSTPSFGSYKIVDNGANPTPPTVTVAGTATGPGSITPAPTPPDLLQYVCWGEATGTPFDYTVDPSRVVANDTGTCQNSDGDAAVLYFFGHDAAHGISLMPAESATVSASIFTPAQLPTAVTVRALDAVRDAKGVRIRWQTGSETGLLGFNVYREVAGRRVRASRALVPSFGRTSGHAYAWVDRSTPRTATVRYWLQTVSFGGARSWLGPATVS